MTDLAQIRQDFPILSQKVNGCPLVYLDTAATAQKPQQVIDAMDGFLRTHYGTVHRAVYTLAVEATEAYQQVRGKVQRLLNAAEAREIIFTRGTTESINMAAYAFGKANIKPGDEIVITEMEHHSNIVPWQILCEDRAARLKVVPFDDDGNLNMDELRRLVTEKTKMVSVTHVSNTLGTVNPIKEIAAIAHERGAKILVDGAQAAAHMPVDVQDLDVDFYAFSGHKLYGPTGIGILYGKAALLESLPPYQGGGDMIKTVTFEKTTYNAIPLKFEAGTPMITEVIGLGAAIDYLEHLGLQNIGDHEQRLVNYLIPKLRKIKGLKIIGNARERGAAVSFIVDGVHPLDIGTLLDLKGIAIRTGHHCTQPTMRHFGIDATARVSLGVFNTVDEVDYFCSCLQEVVGKLR